MDTKPNSFYLAFLAVIAMLAVAKVASSVILPVVISILLAFILNPMITAFVKLKVPRTLAIFIMVILIFAIFYLLGLFLYAGINSFIDEYPKYSQRFTAIVRTLTDMLNNKLNTELPENPLREINWVAALGDTMRSFSLNLVNLFKNFVIIILFLVFLLLEVPHIPKTIHKAFPASSYKIGKIFFHTTKQIGRYLAVKTIISLVTGILVYTLLSLIGMDFAFVWGILAVILNYIPTIGSFIVMFITITMGFVQFWPSAGPIIYVFMTMVAVQVAMGNILEPRLQGRRLNLSPFLILISLFLWGWLWGTVGMFIAVPITAVLKIVMENIPFLKPYSAMMEYGKRIKLKPKKAPPS